MGDDRAGLGRRYWTLWSANTASDLADGVFFVALPILAVRLTDSPLQVAGVSVATTLPWLLFALPAGGVVDRGDRRRLMRDANLVRTAGLAALVAMIVVGHAGLAVAYAVALLVGGARVVFDTGVKAIVPSIVDADELNVANGRLVAATLTAREFLGPPLGGLLAGISLALAFTGTAAGYVLGAVAVALLAGHYRRPVSGPRPIVAEIVDGIRFLWRHPALRLLAVLSGGINFLFYAWQAVFVLYAVEPGPMGLSEFAYGALFAASAAGSIAGTLVCDRLTRRLGTPAVLAASIVGWAVWLAAPVITTNGWIVGALFAIGAFFGVMWGVITVTLRQRLAPDRLIGRVNATHRLFQMGALPLGSLAGGVIAELAGLRPLFALTAIATAALAVPLLRARSALRTPPHNQKT